MNAEHIWMSLAGLGIFMFGMYLLEESIRLLSGKAFKSFIRSFTATPLKGVASGVVATAILQSSSAVSLMVLAFTGAGIMSTQSAIGVVIGSNLGTTFTAWIVALAGFKLKIELLSLPFIGVGGLLLIFSGTGTRLTNLSKLLVGFGFLFMGLDYMKGGVEHISLSFDIHLLNGLPNIVFLLAGLVLTALIQSSSAAMAIILSSLNSGLLEFETACYMVIGTNIGTTITIVIASLNGSSSKKKVAISHIIFNVVTGIIALLLMPFLIHLINLWLGMKNDPVSGLAMFHTLFNLMGVVVFFPFIQWLGMLADKVIRERKEQVTRFIHKTPAEITEGAVQALHNEVVGLVRKVRDFIVRSMRLKALMSDAGEQDIKIFTRKSSSQEISVQYDSIKELQTAIFKYAAEVQKHELSTAEAGEFNAILHAVRNAVSAAKSVKDILHNLDVMDESDLPVARRFRDKFNRITEDYIRQLDHTLIHPNVFDLGEAIFEARERLYHIENEHIMEITTYLKRENISEPLLSSILSVNRNICAAGRYLLLSLKDLMLSAREAQIFDSLEQGEEEGNVS